MKNKPPDINELVNKIIMLQRNMGKPIQSDKEIDRIYESLSLKEVEELKEKLINYDNMIMNKLKEEEMVEIATYAIMKGYDMETLRYSDIMYDKGDYLEDVWNYVEECQNIGRMAFKEKYKQYKLYSI